MSMTTAILNIPKALRPRNIPGKLLSAEARNEFVKRAGLPILASSPAFYFAKMMETEEFLGTRVALFLGMLSVSGVKDAETAIKYLTMLDTANRKVQAEIGAVSNSIDDDFQRIHNYLEPSLGHDRMQNNFGLAWNNFYQNLMLEEKEIATLKRILDKWQKKQLAHE